VRVPVSPGGLPERTAEVIASIAQHRALSTEQVREMHFPGNLPRWMQRVLVRIEEAGHVAHVDVRRAPRRLWFATDSGLELVRAAGITDGELRLFTAEEIAGRFWSHTYAVNGAAVSFVRAARQRGDDFGPLSWRHEVAHPVGPKGAPYSRRVVADALLTYVREADGRIFLEQRFLELDRATRSIEGTAASLGEYARLASARGVGDWRRRYPRLPPVLCVLAGADERTLRRRGTAILALLRSNRALAQAGEVRVSVALARDLAASGPFGPIFRELRRPGVEVDWLGRPGAGDSEMQG
jgi:hypothetical protein